MKGTIKDVKLVSLEVKKGDNKGKKFKKFNIEVKGLVDEERGLVRTFRGSLSEEYGRKYFKYCGCAKLSDVIGRECEITTQQRMWSDDEGNSRTVTEIKYTNLLDNEGKAIILPKEDDEDVVL